MVMQTVGTQLKLVRNMHGIHTPRGQELLKLILNFLTPLTSSVDKNARMNISEDVTNGILWELVHTLLKTQSDPVCSAIPDSVHFGRSLNTLVIRLCVRVDRTIFFAGCTRCLMTSLLEDPDGDAGQMFIKCLYKWADIMSKQKSFIDMELYLRCSNRFYELIHPVNSFNVFWRKLLTRYFIIKTFDETARSKRSCKCDCSCILVQFRTSLPSKSSV
ncbi:hypothetical protein DICVIV_09462 [Dictyocaulus viviparus]|uniref:Uncharacterized protein n=1 Tax=Dictyocaulus viviparus TaxID=29172 RepID=A0A0D8XQ53_DICVI|nr:hypothetical protein DICVIV_09462 [Dictyocaulus viviparus]